MNDPQETLREVVKSALRDHNVKAEELTMVQLADAVSQAIECGDFIRHVHVTGNAQALTYVPGRQVAELRANLATAVEALGGIRESGSVLLFHEIQNIIDAALAKIKESDVK